jgi:hypothetical protein
LIVQKENGDFEAKVFSALGEYAENINVSGECAMVIFCTRRKRLPRRIVVQNKKNQILNHLPRHDQMSNKPSHTELTRKLFPR